MTKGLERFVEAQASCFATVVKELRQGRKRSHWMWFIFPQLRGLGVSSTAQFYGVADADEARAYLEHPVLGPRLESCVHALMAGKEIDARVIFGDIDTLKLRSSMTLFDALRPESTFDACLQRFFGGARDERTTTLLQRDRSG